MKREYPGDPYIGLVPVLGYTLTKCVGRGRIGAVYKAERLDPHDVIACKIIPEGKLKRGWEREIEKLSQLRGIPNVVQYHGHGQEFDRAKRPYSYVLFDYVDGKNLREYVGAAGAHLDIAFIENLTKVLLHVFHACRAVGINHGDLHEGNILISTPDRRIPHSPRTIWVSDFGYGGSHTEIKPKEDHRQTAAVVSALLRQIDQASLNPRDKVMYDKLSVFLEKQILENDATQGSFVTDPATLISKFEILSKDAERESAAATRGNDIREPGDYLSAEALGFRVDEWKDLFVPEFLAAQDLLSRNITVLTGARGCGKTMAFRRLTVFLDTVIGSSSGVKGSDQFNGFYVNCREFAEAFPWIPNRLKRAVDQQLIHYFHLTWFSEICKTLAIVDAPSSDQYRWLDVLVAKHFPNNYRLAVSGEDVLAHVRSFLEAEKESCRLADLGKREGYSNWPLARLDFLDILHRQLETNVSWIQGRPLYLFLDDYTNPIVPSSVQRILNPIIFKRRSNLFFKISTEAANSITWEGFRSKPLELHQDFKFIDLATESLHQDGRERTRLLNKIFTPRIDRHEHFRDTGYGLHNILGKTTHSNNELARQLRDGKKRIVYHGVEAFVGMWASDIRTMIQMLTDMLKDANGQIRQQSGLPITAEIQDRCYRTKGGEFLTFAKSVTDPSVWENPPRTRGPQKQYGVHLVDIAETFINVARYELTKGKMVSNQDRRNPKQAFRLEIIDKFDLGDHVLRYYNGLVRWHIFLQDWRGKSVRGMITPRLYMNRVLIPFANLTFSSHDNIHLTNAEFSQLLETPKEFLKYWIQKKSHGRGEDEGELPFPTLQSDQI
jgi:hypothetical protein